MERCDDNSEVVARPATAAYGVAGGLSLVDDTSNTPNVVR